MINNAHTSTYVNAYNTELRADLTAALAHEAVARRRRREKKR